MRDRGALSYSRFAPDSPITNGDATVRLVDGQELRASRSYRKAITETWGIHGQRLQETE